MPSKISRIKVGKRYYGSGDLLYSEFRKGLRTHKAEPENGVYGLVESYKLELCDFLAKHNYLEAYDTYMVEWLKGNLHSLGSFCYLQGETERHCFPVEVLDSLEERIDYVQSYIDAHCEDFIIPDDPRIIALLKLNVQVRELERAYAVWHKHIFGTQEPNEKNRLIAGILNRLSTYFFTLARYYGIVMEVEEKYWKAKITTFSPPSPEVF